MRSLSRRWTLLVLLLVHAALLAWAANVHSPTVDEVAHLPAGIHHWQHGRFLLYRVNPPLVRAVAALPVWLVGSQTDWRNVTSAPSARPEFAVGCDFLRANGQGSWRLFVLARWACIPFSLLGALVCYRFGEALYGPDAGLWSAALWCFCPNILGHAELITPDVAAAALGILAAYLYWQWLVQPGWSAAIAAGAALGLAELSKTTWIVAFVVWPLLWGLQSLVTRRWSGTQAGQLGLVLLLGVLLINVGYGFQQTFRPLAAYTFTSATLRGADGAEWAGGNRFRHSSLGRLPVPFPQDYVKGIDLQRVDFERRRLSYLRGEFRHTGWWYYYLYGLLMKVPLATWCLIALGTMGRVALRHRRTTAEWMDDLVLGLPAAAVLLLVSSQTGFSHHVRYALPVLPFLFVWSAYAVKLLTTERRMLKGLVAVLFAWTISSSLSVYPHSLSYFHELAGGPRGGPRHLLDSNLDWGQDLQYVQRWLDQHPEVQEIRVAYFGLFAPSLFDRRMLDVGIGSGGAAATTLASAGPPGWYAVSVNRLFGYTPGALQESTDQQFRAFRSMQPVDWAGYSMLIYHIPDNPAREPRGGRVDGSQHTTGQPRIE